MDEEKEVAAVLKAMAKHPAIRRVVLKAAEGYKKQKPMLEAVAAGPCDCPVCQKERGI